MKHFLFAVLAVALAATMGNAQTTQNVTLRVQKIAGNNGKMMFGSYCAPCHGVDGRGNGPVASALKVPPANLTMLSKDNHGQFPATHIAGVLSFGVSVPAHGTPEMPVWGPTFHQLFSSNSAQSELIISNLVRYLRSLQAQ